MKLQKIKRWNNAEDGAKFVLDSINSSEKVLRPLTKLESEKVLAFMLYEIYFQTEVLNKSFVHSETISHSVLSKMYLKGHSLNSELSGDINRFILEITKWYRWLPWSRTYKNMTLIMNECFERFL